MCDFFFIFVKDLFMNSINRYENERQAQVCRLHLNVMHKVPDNEDN